MEHSRQLTAQLPLKLYESFMLHDESPAYPMTFALELRLSGQLDRDAFQEACEDAVRLHPLLTTRVEKSRWRYANWVPSDLPPPVDWSCANDGHPPRPGPIDITAEPGLRIWVRDDPLEPRIWLQFHHVATDGIGAMQFVGDLLARYGVRTASDGQRRPEPAPVSIERLHEREILWPEPQYRDRLLSTSLRRLWSLSVDRPKPLAARRSDLADATSGDPPEPGVFPPFHTRILDSQTLHGLKSSASRRMITLNDFTTLAVFRALRAWNREQGQLDPDACLRLSLPLNLRLPLHDDSPASNHLSLMLLSRVQGALDDTDEVLRYIHRATEICAGGIEGRLFTYWAGGLASRVPWLFRLGGGRGCFCTAILANIGRVRRHVRGRFPLDAGRIVAGSVRLEAL
ncbi:MAG: hypothetical protein KDA75_21175, partial [Planctomycetaceae bacterium]|nr:hypothetical protein [Planctomycetaceae bacterium]